MNIKILRVLGIRSKDPGVLATVDGYLVKWSSRRPWDCECLSELDEFECAHIEAVRELLDNRVFQPLSPFEDPTKMVVLK